MGVQGLFSFIEANSIIYRDHRLSGSKLLIDGCNLYYLLYFGTGLDLRHGGEYRDFEELVEKFIGALRSCRIEPYVLLDGGADPSDKKLETITKRAKDRILKAHSVAMGGEGNILPTLCKVVVRQTLTRLKVSWAQCYAEADLEIASLAREWRCPVLSNDSDFYILELPAGLLPIEHFHWDAVSGGSVPCKLYTTSSFCTLFDIAHYKLPLLAALAGNDYVKLRELGLNPNWAQFAPQMPDGRLDHVGGLVRWLRIFQRPEDALAAALVHLGILTRPRAEEVRDALRVGMSEYRIPPSELLGFFRDGSAPPLPQEARGVVPDWLRLPLTRGQLSSDVLDVLLMGGMSLPIPVDSSDRPSANLTSRPLRQALYGLLAGARRGRGGKVTERDREGRSLIYVQVQPVLRGDAQQLKLGTLNKAQRPLLLRVLLTTLNVSETALSQVPEHLRLPVAVTCYWQQQATPTPAPWLVQAVLLGLVDGEAQTRTRTRGPPANISKRPLDLEAVHSLNQWQLCLNDAMLLNQLLQCPLLTPRIGCVFQGTYLHRLLPGLKAGAEPQLQEQDAELYRVLQETLLLYRPQQRRLVEELSASLKQLHLHQAEEGERDERSVLEQGDSWTLVSLKNRHRTKDRCHRHNVPELCRNRDSRSWGQAPQDTF